jgi:mobilome CxxCx(11)CxxC protein
LQDSNTTELIVRNNSHDHKLHTFGYSKIFSKRASKYNSRINLITKIGFLLPGVLGGYVLTFGIDQDFQNILYIFVPLSLAQFILSLWASLSKWDDEYSYALEASSHYSSLNTKFKNLAAFSADTFDELKSSFINLDTEYDNRSQQDGKHNIKEWERRYGMRTALREYQKECVNCHLIPYNYKSTDCDVCGNFSFKHKILNL